MYIFFWWTKGSNQNSSRIVDKGPTWPDGLSVLSHHREAPPIQIQQEEEEDRDICDVEWNLKGLTMGVPPMCILDVPRCLKRHVIGVFAGMSQLLHRVARPIVGPSSTRGELVESPSTILYFWDDVWCTSLVAQILALCTFFGQLWHTFAV